MLGVPALSQGWGASVWESCSPALPPVPPPSRAFFVPSLKEHVFPLLWHFTPHSKACVKMGAGVAGSSGAAGSPKPLPIPLPYLSNPHPHRCASQTEEWVLQQKLHLEPQPGPAADVTQGARGSFQCPAPPPAPAHPLTQGGKRSLTEVPDPPAPPSVCSSLILRGRGNARGRNQ